MGANKYSAKWVGLLCRLFVLIGTAFLILAAMVGVVEAVAFDRGFYASEYDKLGSADYVGVERPVLDEATENLLSYLEGKRENLDMTADIGGQQREFYNEREKTHMVDVAVLNQNAVRFMWVMLPLGVVLIAAARLISKNSRLVWQAAFYSIIIVLAGFGVIAAWAAADFTSFWISFHHVFFSNDLWQFDPATSLLIRMFEQTFFFDMVGKILAIFIAGVLAALAVTGIMSAKRGRQLKKAAGGERI